MFSLFAENLPSLWQIAILGPISFVAAGAYLTAAGTLKRRRAWPTGYTRKVFHVLVFATAATVQTWLGLSALFVFGAATSAIILYAVMCGEGHLWFEAIARESDSPRRTHFILVPYSATLLGGLLSNAWFGRDAVFGYLVAGLGDAVGEPIGTRFGRHRYRVPSLRDVPTFRSVEGSLAVFLVSLAAAATAQLATRGSCAAPISLLTIALVSTVVEAVSPHGWDNLTMLLVPSALAALLMQP